MFAMHYSNEYMASNSGDIYSLKFGRIKKLKQVLINTGYYAVCVNTDRQHSYTAHRFVFECFNGPVPDDMQVDHIDGNKLNNAISNLRLVSASENMWNHRAAKGCYYNKRSKKWRAQISVSNKKIFLGSFLTELEAAQAYLDAKSRLHKIGGVVANAGYTA